MKKLLVMISLLCLTALVSVGIGKVHAQGLGPTANCYNYTPDTQSPLNCNTNDYCQSAGYGTASPMCKQLCVPLVDPGCCSYDVVVDYWQTTSNGGGNNPTCPCAVPGGISTNVDADNYPYLVCTPSAGGSYVCGTSYVGSCIAGQPQ